jgi:hypothetical protein
MSETIKNYGRSIKTKLLNIVREEQTFYGSSDKCVGVIRLLLVQR